MKNYEIKTYTRLGVFKSQINNKNIVSDISFSEEINGGQSNMTLSVVGDLADYSPSDIVEIREVNTDNRQISPTYSGIITNIGVTEFQTAYILALEIYGVSTRLSSVIYTSGGSRKFTKNATPGVIVKEIIDSFNSVYGTLSGTQVLTTNLIRYTTDSIDITGTSASIEFDYETCLSSISKVVENSGFVWFVGADGIFYLKKETDLPITYITFDREIIAISKKLKTDEMRNKIYYQITGGSESSYQDASSQALYGVHEGREVDSDIQNATTAQTKSTELMTKYGYEVEETAISLKPQRSADFTPLVRITTLNTRTPITGKSIVRVEKRKDGITLAIGDFPSLARAIRKIV